MIENFSNNIPKPSELARNMVEKLFGLNVENEYHIEEVKEFLDLDSQKNNLILYFNHISYPDPVFVYWLYQKYLDPALLRQAILPASYYHTQFTHNPAFTTFYKLGKAIYGYEDVRLVQSYMVGERYTQEQAMKSYRELISAIKTHKNQRPLSLILSPEGHRADDGLRLQKGDDGIVKLAKMMAPAIVLPVGISYPQRRYQRSSLNFGQKVNLSLGVPTTVDSRQDNHFDYRQLMTNLAMSLPEDMRGYWQDNGSC
jgi:1-acyl-sn-glycerol-3-phosphate acyltransferase